jgi:anion-transporting  ArsA/GET3 family ATPase
VGYYENHSQKAINLTRTIKGPLKEIHFVTGKGGVGKSTYAALLAAQFAKQNRKTLLVEIGERSFYSSLFQKPIEYKPTQIEKNLEVAHWSATECLKSYVLSLVKVQALYKLFFENPVTKSLIQVAPALSELAIVGQITSSPRQHGPHGDHEILVVDAYATGHFLNLVMSPQAMALTIPLGPMHDQSQKMDQVLRDSDMCHCHIVTIAEELVLTESLELLSTIKKEFDWKPNFILNRFLETTLKSQDLKNQDQFLLQALQNKLLQQELAIKLLSGKVDDIKTLPLAKKIQTFEDVESLL